MGFSGNLEGKESACNVGDRVQSLGQEDPLEKEMANHSNILAWKIPWTEESAVHGISESWARLNKQHL